MQTRQVSTSSRRSKPEALAVSSVDAPSSPYSKEYLLSLVPEEEAGSVDEYLQIHRDPYLRRYPEPDGPHITVSRNRRDVMYPSQQDATHGDPEIERINNLLAHAIATRWLPRNFVRASLDGIYRLYLKLPEPRMLRIPADLRFKLLRTFGMPGQRDTMSMMRYFALVNEVKIAGLPLRLQEWNFALSFASRYVRTTTEVEVEKVVQLWSEMERTSGTKSNEVTFNILFDAASKAGNFTLAEMIYKEMEHRGLRFNRYHHVSLIHFFGLKQDADGVRAAYREMVKAGEIIDTVALNCVLSGLLLSGEETAAEEVYERMKGAFRGHAEMAPRDYYSNKVMNKVLMKYGRLGKKYPALRSSLQKMGVITPDIQTYRILIKHFGRAAGNLSKVTKYLDEMKFFRVPLHGGIFVLLFQAFTAHGGYMGTSWSEKRLRGAFGALLEAIDGGAAGLYIDVWLAMCVVRAFKRCGPDEAVLDVYEQLLARMQISEGQKAFLEDFLQDVMANRDAHMYRKRMWFDSYRKSDVQQVEAIP